MIADDSADPVRLAADLLIEAEHGTDTSVVLHHHVGTIADAVDVELDRQLADLPDVRADGRSGGARPQRRLRARRPTSTRRPPSPTTTRPNTCRSRSPTTTSTASSTRSSTPARSSIGQHTPFSAANFVIGCPASLPTSGFAHVSSGITADAFLKRTAVARADAQALERMTPSVLALADHEGFPAHGNALRLRRG